MISRRRFQCTVRCGFRPDANRPALRGGAGFTIVEVMMAATILVVGFMGMIQAITIGSEMLATARHQTLAAQIMEHEISKLRLTSWATISAPLPSVPSTNYTSLIPDDTHFDAAITASGVSFNLSRSVTNVTTDLYEVSLTLTWTKSGTTTYTRKSIAFFGKYGLNLSIQRS